MAVRDGPDDIFRSPRGITAEKDASPGRHHRRLVDLRHAPVIKLDTDVALDPGEAVLLADCHQDVIAGKHHLFSGGLQPRPSARVDSGFAHELEADTSELA